MDRWYVEWRDEEGGELRQLSAQYNSDMMALVKELAGSAYEITLRRRGE